jgi:hypothetical protein
VKRCSRCRKPGEFAKNASKKDGLNCVCKACQQRYAKSHYQANKVIYLDRAAKRNLAISTQWRETVIREKSRPCADCGKSFPHYVMDFDHVRGEKLFSVSAGRREGFGLDRLMEEIAKCEVVCANCHRERTFGPETRPHSSSG